MKRYIRCSSDTYTWTKEHSEFGPYWLYDNNNSDTYGTIQYIDNDGDWMYDGFAITPDGRFNESFSSRRYKDPLNDAKRWVESKLKSYI